MEQKLFLSHCRLTSQPDLSERAFTKIDFHANDISVIHDEMLPSICKEIDFSSNQIAEDGIPMEWPDQIEHIFLYNNRIYSADGIHWPVNLKVLDMDDNPLESVPCPLPDSIEELTLSRTNIQVVEKLPANLRELTIHSSRLYRLPAVIPDTLVKAILAKNYLSYRGLPGHWGTSLQYLDLANNRIKTFPTGLPDTLEVLLLNQNKIETIPEKLPENLKQLSLNNNKIQTILLQKRETPIEVLSLYDNQLTIPIPSRTVYAKCILSGANWNTREHETASRLIQKNWRISRIVPRIRTWRKLSKIKQELYMIALHPDRILQTDDFSKWHFGC